MPESLPAGVLAALSVIVGLGVLTLLRLLTRSEGVTRRMLGADPVRSWTDLDPWTSSGITRRLEVHGLEGEDGREVGIRVEASRFGSWTVWYERVPDGLLEALREAPELRRDADS